MKLQDYVKLVNKCLCKHLQTSHSGTLHYALYARAYSHHCTNNYVSEILLICHYVFRSHIQWNL